MGSKADPPNVPTMSLLGACGGTLTANPQYSHTMCASSAILLLQHMLWHEGYHHGQIKLALKVAGRPMDDPNG